MAPKNTLLENIEVCGSSYLKSEISVLMAPQYSLP